MAAPSWRPLELQAGRCDPGAAGRCSGRSEESRLKLLALGWRIEWKRDSMTRFRYHSPEGKVYYSLNKVCCDLMETNNAASNAGSPPLSGITDASCSSPRSSPVKTCPKRVVAPKGENLEAEYIPDAIHKYVEYLDSKNQKDGQGFSYSSATRLRVNAKKHLLFMGWRFWFKDKKIKFELRYASPKGKSFISLYTACKSFLEECPQETSAKSTALDSSSLEVQDEFGSTNHCSIEDKKEQCKRRIESVDDRSSGCRQSKRKKAPQASNQIKESDRVMRSSKRSRPVTALATGKHVSRTVLSCLINNDIVLPREKVSYVCKRGRVMKDGRIVNEGIKCTCCLKIFSVSDFEYHANRSRRQRPAASMFLQDGRSLLECQVQMMQAEKPWDFPHTRAKIDCSEIFGDYLCSACHDAGTLVLCDGCPSAFHLGCVGLEEVPEGDWFCPSCHCGICGFSDFNSDANCFTKKTMLYCDQCEKEFHVGCLRMSGVSGLRSCPTGDWFCSNTCSEIFTHLRELVGRVNQTSVKGLSWTLLRANGVDEVETMAEHHSKLHVALEILHECFVTITEERTQSDFVSDLLFNRESELRRLNFWGFYTMIVEKGDEVISVATFRVLGDKIAEMPLVGTRVDYRKQGMCRLIVTELEKLLSVLGVKRLLLPAVPQLLETWINSFRFSKMSSSDKKKLMHYNVLNFQDTTMCQKILTTV